MMSRDENDIVDSATSEEEEEEDSQIDSGTEEDEEPLPAGRSYATLMRRLIADSAPQPKRRKLDHGSEPAASQNEDLEDVEDDQVREDVDQVEEPEEGPETAIDGLLEDGEEKDSEDASDPFEAHFADPDENLLSRRLKSLQNNQWATQKSLLPKVGRAIFSVPQEDDLRLDSAPATISGPGDLKLKQKMASVISKQRPSFDSLEKHIAPYIFNYRDVLYCERDLNNSENLQRLVCLHAVNHVFKSVSILRRVTT
jgi:U3 small nucleolar RNA-associated protein 25